MTGDARLQTDMNDFYIDRLPDNNYCYYCSPHLFINEKQVEAHLQIVDDRWTSETVEDILRSPISDGYSDFFEVMDIESNVSGSEQWVVGFSLFFLKHALDQAHLHRETAEAHQKLVDGVRVLIEHPERSHDSVLRFYVSEEAWDTVASQGLIGQEHTQFYKMVYPSEDSQVGTMWRLLALCDKDYEYATQTDIAPDEDWIIPRITDWGHDQLLKRLGAFPIAGEVQALKYRTEKEIIKSMHGYPESQLTRFDHLTPGGIVTRPSEIPNLVPLFCKYLETSSTLTLFNCESNAWTKYRQDDHLPYGWSGLGCDQNVWRYLKRVIRMRHVVYEPWVDEFLREYPDDHYFVRMIKQHEQGSHEFVVDGTQQPLLEAMSAPEQPRRSQEVKEIEKVIVINLPRRKDRYWFMKSNLMTQGVPDDKIEFYPARDGKDYGSCEEIIEAAAADGFPSFLRDITDGDERESFAYYWNWACILRDIIENDRLVMVVLDDRPLEISWQKLTETVKSLQQQYLFKILQLGWWLEDEDNLDRGEAVPGVTFGIQCHGEYGTVLSAEGAALLLKLVEDSSWWASLEVAFYEMRNLADQTGLFQMANQAVGYANQDWGEDLTGQ